MEKISIIVPIYNNEKYLDKCLTSIIKQTYKNLEIILINDGSQDKSLEIIRKYEKQDKRIIVIDKKNEGVSKARNDGIKASTGEYITFADSDDYLELDEIEKMYDAIKKNKVDAVRINYQVRYNNSDKLDRGNLNEFAYKKLNSKELKTSFLEGLLEGSIPCFSCLIMVKRSILLETNLFATDISMMEDVVLYIELMHKLKSMFILDDVYYNVNFNEEGVTNHYKNYEKNIFSVISVNKHIKDILKKEKNTYEEYTSKLDVSNVNAIADFIFKQYLFGLDTISLCKKLSNNNDFNNILNNLDYSKINIQRKILIKLIYYKKFSLLKIYFSLRKVIYNIKNKGSVKK